MVKNILTLLLGVIFLITSSGFMLYETICSCTGNEQTSVFVKPETCEETFHAINEQESHQECCSSQGCDSHAHHHESQGCGDCINHVDDCGCDEPIAKLLKLKNSFDEEVRYTLSTPVLLSIASTEMGFLQEETSEGEDDNISYVDPPPKITSSLDFLIQIQQLKIPALA